MLDNIFIYDILISRKEVICMANTILKGVLGVSGFLVAVAIMISPLVVWVLAPEELIDASTGETICFVSSDGTILPPEERPWYSLPREIRPGWRPAQFGVRADFGR